MDFKVKSNKSRSIPAGARCSMATRISLVSTAIPEPFWFLATHAYVAVSLTCALIMLSLLPVTYFDFEGSGICDCVPRSFAAKSKFQNSKSKFQNKTSHQYYKQDCKATSMLHKKKNDD